LIKGPESLQPGQWFQGSGEDDRIAAARQLVDDARLDQFDPNPARFEKLLVGNAAREVLAGAICRPESTAKLLSQMIADIERDAQRKTEALLEQCDLNTQEAKELHFKARVDRAMIALLRKYTVMGDESHDQLNNQETTEE
jgi:hypothetical protein